jgi:hypothetical protein
MTMRVCEDLTTKEVEMDQRQAAWMKEFAAHAGKN